MKIPAEDYGPLKGFFGWMLANEMAHLTSLAPESHPLAVIANLESKSPATARRGLAMAIGDIVEMLAGASQEEVRRIDDGLQQNGLPSFTSVRARFWRKIPSILRRGRIRNEAEYQSLRNVVEAMSENDAGAAWAILADFEKSSVAAGAR